MANQIEDRLRPLSVEIASIVMSEVHRMQRRLQSAGRDSALFAWTARAENQRLYVAIGSVKHFHWPVAERDEPGTEILASNRDRQARRGFLGSFVRREGPIDFLRPLWIWLSDSQEPEDAHGAVQQAVSRPQRTLRERR